MCVATCLIIFDWTKSAPMKNLLLLPFILLLACTQTKKTPDESTQLGELGHTFSMSDEVKPFFDKGLLLLHSFEYEDAREEFEKAKEIDPNELMTYWGLAMTHYKALWGLQDVDAGREIMNDFGADQEVRLGKAENELEKDLWMAVEILYGEGEFLERNRRYVKHMEKVYNDNPDNLEVAAFYSLGLMWAGYDNQENLKISSQVAASIIEENPTHPGALHYMIHANDDPQFAIKAIDAANEYAQVAPDAAHALHMPSHIYVALGMWKEVVSSNTDSYQASLTRMERKGLSGKSRGYHSMAWLHYGYLQLGRYDEAADLMKEMISYNLDNTASKSYLINMQNQQRIESGIWPDSLEFQDVDVSAAQIGMEGKAQIHFVKSLLAFDRGDSDGIEDQIESLLTHLESAKLQVTEDGIALCSAGPTRYAPDEESINRTQVVIYQMQALLASSRNDLSSVEASLQKAVELEEEVGYDPGPPFIAYPSYEHYGDWLLTQDRFEEALVMFDKSLNQRTNRSNALKGKKAALESLNRDKEAQRIADLLAKLEIV